MDKIQFISTVEHLDSIEECRPKPAKYFMPDWFKNIPSKYPFTVKRCPSFPDYFSQGYVVPMWCDTTISFDKGSEEWKWNTSGGVYHWEIHSKQQMLDYVTPSFRGFDGNFVFKALCPWQVITPPGWSVLQLPLFYHFNKEWSVMPGVIDTDIHHDINQQVLYHSENTDIVINRGDPFALYIPFKRKDKLEMEIRYQTEKDKKIFDKMHMNLKTKYTGGGVYRSIQRLRDKNG